MACNTIPKAYPSLIVHITEATDAATAIGPGIPLLINRALELGQDRQALITGQADYKASRRAIVPLVQARKSAVARAYAYAFKVRGVLENFLGRGWSDAWLGTGWESNLIVPQSFDDLYALSLALVSYLTENPTQQNEELEVTVAAVQSVEAELRNTNNAVLAAEAVSLAKKSVRDAKVTAVRKRLNGLCKELSQRLDDLDPRWRRFGFNMPGAASVPEIPEDVVITPLPAAKLQIACAPSTNATGYRFYTQRPIFDPEPVLAGSSTAPLFVTEPLVAAQPYVIYISAVNEGAESELSDPVTATPVLSAAA